MIVEKGKQYEYYSIVKQKWVTIENSLVDTYRKNRCDVREKTNSNQVTFLENILKVNEPSTNKRSTLTDPQLLYKATEWVMLLSAKNYPEFDGCDPDKDCGPVLIELLRRFKLKI